jgi:hypothetical protein
MSEIIVPPPGMKYNNAWVFRKRHELVEEFGGKCQSTEGCFEVEKLEFAHRIGYRIKGMARGKKVRILDIRKNKDHYILLCKKCHCKYDRDNPLTEEESKTIAEEVPF